MKTMALSDLVNLMWSVQEINKGSDFFYKTLEKEISNRIRAVKDSEFKILLECLADDKSKFSERFLRLVI